MNPSLNILSTVARMIALSPKAVTKYGEKKVRDKLYKLTKHLKDNGTQGYSADWLLCQSVGGQSDSNMINAAIASLTPRESVVLGSCELGFILRSQAYRYAKAMESNAMELELYWTGYEAFANLTEGFLYIPIITIPIHLGNHWGMCVVVPDPVRGRAQIYWGDSLGWAAPAGVLQLLRALLSLLYKKAVFCIEEKNYMSSVLGFENQRDSHSCGFYVLAACATFTLGPTSGEKLPIYSTYCEKFTEQYRRFCFEAFVGFIMQCNADVSHILSSVGQAIKVQRCSKVLFMNAGRDMYAEHNMRDQLLRSDDLLSVHGLVHQIEPKELKPIKQGLYSPATAILLSQGSMQNS